MMAPHVVIGGGIIGLACAWRLRQEGRPVMVIDAAPEAREASWAAGGMLAPYHEAEADGPLLQMGVRSLKRWPSFLQDVGLGTEQVDYHAKGGLIPVLDPLDLEEVAQKQAVLEALDVAIERLDAAALAALEPSLTSAQGALLVPGAQVDPRRMLTALRLACVDSGVELRYGATVTAITETGLCLDGQEQLAADQIVLASGAWTAALAELTGVSLQGEPVKGQMVRFAVPDGLLGRFVHCRHAYCIPRQDQGVLVGATMVTSGFDRSEDPEAIAQLAAGARHLVPALQQAELAETWTGLRPRLSGGLPLIDRINSKLVIATGHFRNGILLTPWTADLVADLVTGRAEHGFRPADVVAIDSV